MSEYQNIWLILSNVIIGSNDIEENRNIIPIKRIVGEVANQPTHKKIIERTYWASHDEVSQLVHFHQTFTNFEDFGAIYGSTTLW